MILSHVIIQCSATTTTPRHRRKKQRLSAHFTKSGSSTERKRDASELQVGRSTEQ